MIRQFLLLLTIILVNQQIFANSVSPQPDKFPYKITSEQLGAGFEQELIGEIQVDYAHYISNPTRLANGEILRRAEIGYKGTVTPEWIDILNIDFGNPQRIRIKDAYFGYIGYQPWMIRIGNFREFIGLEKIESNKNLVFLERALVMEALVPDRHIGIGANSYFNITPCIFLTFGTGLFGGRPGAAENKDKQYDEQYAIATRLTAAARPLHKALVHVGLSYLYHQPNNNHIVFLNSRPESAVTNVSFIDTGEIHNVDLANTYGIELITQYGQLYFQGEYIATAIRRFDAGNLLFKGWYGYLSFILTGETRAYDEKLGILNRIKIDNCYWGAWELGVRYSVTNLTSGAVIGGQEHNISLALNWYVNNYVRFMVDYIKVYANQSGLVNGPKIYTARAQVTLD